MKTTLTILALLALNSCTSLSGTSVTYQGHTFTYTSAKGVVSDVEPTVEVKSGWVETALALWNLWK